MIEFLKIVARQAGALALSENVRLRSADIHTKATPTDLVTEADRRVEEFLFSTLSREYPDFGFFGEETGKHDAQKEYCFIIDPIDGTASFIHHLPNWCVSIGLHRNGKPVAGVVYQPTADLLYSAEAGQGAWCNGMRLHVSGRAKLVDCIVAAGFWCLRAGWKEENNLKFFPRVASKTADIRKYGSAALDCARVADGTLDAFWELCLAPYDFAAGELLVTEAGGIVCDLFGGSDYPRNGIMFSNGLVRDEMLSCFSDYQALQR